MRKDDQTIARTDFEKKNHSSDTGDRCLVIIDHYGNETEVNLDKLHKDRIRMGRRPDNDLVISSPLVSGEHGRFKVVGKRLLYADLGSLNGTIIDSDGYRHFVRGNRKYHELKSGDMLRIQAGDQATGGSVLILYSAESKGGSWIRFPMLSTVTKIGRESSNDIVLASPMVSRNHAKIERQGEQYILSDTRSSNGVFVNGRRRYRNYILQDKDVIQIANHTLIFSGHMIIYRNNVRGINIEIRNLNKYVDHRKKKILDQVNCTVESNEFVAIVGGSGAGKTTLMNAISGFDKKIEGDIYYNSIRVHDHFSELKGLIGYVPQEDIIYENLTLQKMLYYTAEIKMPADTSKAEIDARIQAVLAMVELSDHKNTYIRKLSGGQKKRASIAVELLADPSVFFLDEPTSGLDPGTEQKLMITLNKLAKSQGKTIIMVTHTTQSLELCDKVIFMGRGGRLCFAGTTAQAKQFFQTNNLVDIYNKITDDPLLWSQQFSKCSEQEHISRLEDKQALGEKKDKAGLRQLSVLAARYLLLVRNDLQRLILLFSQPVLIAILLSLVANKYAFLRYDDTKTILFALSSAGIWVGLFNSIQEICKERAILKREYMGNLRLSYYILSKFLIQSLIGCLQALLMAGIFSVLVGHAEEGILFSNPFFETFFTIWMTIMASMAIGLVISASVKNGDRALSLAPFVLIFQLLFAGILFKLEGAKSSVAWLTVSKWSVESLGSIAVLNDLPRTIQKTMPIALEPERIFISSPEHLIGNWFILLSISIVCGVLCMVLLRSLSSDGR